MNYIIKNKRAGYVITGIVIVIAVLIAITSMPSGKDDFPEHAKALFEHKVENIDDTALVAELFEVMEVEQLTGEYAVEISKEGDTLVLALNVLEGVQNADKSVFDENMKTCAQQMLVLIPQVDRVQWTYQVITAADKEEVSVESFGRVDFETMFGKAPEYFGKTEESLKTLLEQQKAS